ncbi:hypothetical protein ACLKA7_012571 [Drosophila subpalustris]
MPKQINYDSEEEEEEIEEEEALQQEASLSECVDDFGPISSLSSLSNFGTSLQAGGAASTKLHRNHWHIA